jgi:hypothetical protein
MDWGDVVFVTFHVGVLITCAWVISNDMKDD